jgi:hypothetical protein
MSPQETDTKDPAVMDETRAKASSTNSGHDTTESEIIVLMCVYFVVHLFSQAILPYITAGIFCNCCISSRKINHCGAHYMH